MEIDPVSHPPPIAQGRVEVLLSRLQGVIRTRDDAWLARCPAHDDRSPSLSVRQTSDKVLFHCYTGCPPEDILAAVGLKWIDLYEDRWDAAHAAAVVPQRRRPNAQRVMVDGVDIEVERTILKIAAADVRAGKSLSIEDRGRVEVARLRVAAADQGGA
ncbi:MAG: CHC2 zinc finger domain-containing protein [Halochromatium sp.]|uniref:CHC2 zinc finger domain-containing protein n=1 Tax=Halochromatium sp. TaxID=2049430 RepID=UPI003979FC13